MQSKTAAIAPRSNLRGLGDGPPAIPDPTRRDLLRIMRLRHGQLKGLGRGIRRQLRFGYFTPDEYYEALVDKLVKPGAYWLDVGCGRDVFPKNTRLAQRLASRCEFLMGVDPDRNVLDNRFVHDCACEPIESFHTDLRFDLITLRMVAEHLPDPDTTLARLAELTKPGGKVAVYTVNRWSPVSVAAYLTPHRLHHYVKYLLWRTEERDTFPVAYRMNTARQLNRVFARHGFGQVYFRVLDDCRTFARFHGLHFVELAARSGLHAAGLHYPENCLLGVYQRSIEPT